MILTCFSRSGIENVIALSPQEALNRESFVERVLADFDEEREQNRPKKCSRATFLHLNNATLHQAL
jgi:hypothetical protein